MDAPARRPDSRSSDSRSGSRRVRRTEAGAPALRSRDFALFFTARAVARPGDTLLPVARAAGLPAVPAIRDLVRADPGAPAR